MKAGSSLAARVSSKDPLEKLSLSENELKDEGAVEIAKALEEGHREPKEVDLSSNVIRRGGCKELGSSFPPLISRNLQC